MAQTTNVGHMSAWSLARSRGYTGTREEYAELMASYATVAQQAQTSATSAGQSATDASGSAQTASTASTAAQQAQTAAETAQASAQGYATAAQASAQSAQGYAQSAESAKETAVDAVDGFAAGAQQALESVNSAGINWKSLAEAQKLDSEAWATGKRDGADVGSSDETYHNNAKYYAESAATDATTASDAAQTATTKAGEAQASASAAAESARTLTIDATLTQAGQGADAKVTGDEIGALKEGLSHFPELENLFDSSAVTADSYINVNSGAVSTHSGWYATDWIPVRKGVTYYIGGFYLSYNALYDADKVFKSGNVITQTGYLLGTFTPAQDGYFRGTCTSTALMAKAYISPYFAGYVDYSAVLDFSHVSEINTYEEAQNARGETSQNLLRGDCFYGEFDTSTGALKFSANAITTPLIAISGVVYYKMFNGGTHDIQYCYEYDSAKAFIKYTTLNGKPSGYLVLDDSTAYVRFRSQTESSSYTLPTPKEYTENLLVSDSLSIFGRQVTMHNVTGQSGVKHDLFDRSIAFEKSYVASAIKTYAETFRDTFYDFVMPINTDLHAIDAEAYNMLTYMAESGYADICFNLGDNVPSVFNDREQTVTLLEAVRLWNHSNNIKCPILVLRGNHDNNPVNDMSVDKMIPDALWYNIMHNRTRKGFYKAGVNYGYLDFEQSKIRVIWIDSGDIYDASTGDPLTSGYNVMVQQAQFDWFCNVALDFSKKTDASEWSVITISHAQISAQLSTAFAVVLKAFMDGTTASGSASTAYGNYTNILTYDVDYSLQGAVDYICHVNGHTHDDNAVLIGSTGRYDIDIACDNQTAYYYSGGTRTPYTRTAGTIEEHLMDTLCIDKANRKIYMKRLGVGSDRTFTY